MRVTDIKREPVWLFHHGVLESRGRARKRWYKVEKRQAWMWLDMLDFQCSGVRDEIWRMIKGVQGSARRRVIVPEDMDEIMKEVDNVRHARLWYRMGLSEKIWPAGMTIYSGYSHSLNYRKRFWVTVLRMCWLREGVLIEFSREILRPSYVPKEGIGATHWRETAIGLCESYEQFKDIVPEQVSLFVKFLRGTAYKKEVMRRFKDGEDIREIILDMRLRQEK
ncbi:MAG: hypothetical protein DRH44_07575 [Candidatus Coatesbacteria bacterium]|nr:MAG: hypothetical protein DRH44_07575 [Candidatus Coatesbacteria bacterium]